MEKIKLSHVGEVLVILTTIHFILKLNSYNRILYAIKDKYATDSSFNLLQVWEIAREPSYFSYLFGGILFIALLIGYSYVVFKFTDGIEVFLIAFINLVLLITLLIVFWNPILTTFASLLLGSAICGYMNS